MYPGTDTPSLTGIVHWQNGQTQLNRLVKYKNGVGLSTVHMGLDNELDATSIEHMFDDSHSNGMQFEPSVDNNNNILSQIKVVDATNLLLMTYDKTQ